MTRSKSCQPDTVPCEWPWTLIDIERNSHHTALRYLMKNIYFHVWNIWPVSSYRSVPLDSVCGVIRSHMWPLYQSPHTAYILMQSSHSHLQLSHTSRMRGVFRDKIACSIKNQFALMKKEIVDMGSEIGHAFPLLKWTDWWAYIWKWEMWSWA